MAVQAPPRQQQQQTVPPPDVLTELRWIRCLLQKIDTWLVTLGTLYILNMIVRAISALTENAQ